MRKLLLLFLIIIAISGCKKEIEFNGNIEVYVKKVNSICEVPYDNIIIGLFPPEAINSGTSAFEAISSKEIDENGYIRFDDLPAGIFVVGVKASNCNANKYAIVRSGETTKVNLVD